MKQQFLKTILLSISTFLCINTSNAQEFHFSTVNSTNCTGYAATPTIKILGVLVTASWGSGFNYQIQYEFTNLITGSGATGTYWNYNVTLNGTATAPGNNITKVKSINSLVSSSSNSTGNDYTDNATYNNSPFTVNTGFYSMSSTVGQLFNYTSANIFLENACLNRNISATASSPLPVTWGAFEINSILNNSEISWETYFQ